jgi:hypothetical protein
VNVFVPMHNRRARATGGRPAPGTRPLVAVASVFVALAAGLIPAILSKKDAGTGEYVVLGLVIAALAVGGGIALARMIGRRGKV